MSSSQPSNKHFYCEHRSGGVAWLRFDNPSGAVNILSEAALLELNDLLTELSSGGTSGLVIYSGKSGQFIAGADIEEIEQLTHHPEDPQGKAREGAQRMQAVFQRLSELSFPTVCAIDGTCLGGGLELALACDYRIATDHPSTKLGLPEVQLGLLPGAGGTQRLPRLIGLISAIDLITASKKVAARKAYKLGLVDAVVAPNQLLEIATECARSNGKSLKKGQRKRKKSLINLVMSLALQRNPFGRKLIMNKAQKAIDKQTKGFYPAPGMALKAIMEGYALPLNLGLAREAKYFAQLSMTSQSRSCIHLYHATQHIKKSPYIVSEAPSKRSQGAESEYQNNNRGRKSIRKKLHSAGSTAAPLSSGASGERSITKDPQKVTLIGGGFMGAGIATICAARGVSSIISDPSQEAIGKALSYADRYFRSRLKRRRMKPFEASQKLASISPGLTAQGFQNSDIVIEAVPENLELKKKILSNLEKDAPSDWIFASNTSALPISDIASTAKNPGRVIGMHFFSPAEKMPLLEVVKTEKSDHDALAVAVKLGQKLGKQVIVVQDGPGFYTTRALAFYLAEAITLLEEGANAELIDTTMSRAGFPVGPLVLLDEVGIDVGYHVLKTIHKAFPDRISPSVHVPKFIEEGRLGRKSGKGIYLYHQSKKSSSGDGLKKEGVDPQIYKLLQVKEGSGSNPPPTAEEIKQRLLLIFVNESLRCFDDGILDHPYDGDVGAVFGLGFPPFLGGPFHYVDQKGARTILSDLDSLQRSYGKRFEPAASLKSKAKDDQLYFPRPAAQVTSPS